MGVHGLWQLLKPSSRPVTLENLEGKILAVDISVWLHQASKGMRDRYGNPVPNAHLVVLFRRICKLLFYKIKPIFVFDGGIPILKRQTLAHRRELKEVANEESDRISDKILKNLLKQQLLKEAVQKKTEKKQKKNDETGPSVSSVLPTQPKQRDLFELEPLPESKQRYLDEIEAEAPWEDYGRFAVHASYQDLSKIDTESEEFKSLPPEIQHEFLIEMKESMKRTSWSRIQNMPQKADDFSSFQMKKILKQSTLSLKVDSVRNEMNNQNSGRIAKEFGCSDASSVIARQLASEDDAHFIFVKGLQKSAALKTLEEHRSLKEKEDSKDFLKEEEKTEIRNPSGTKNDTSKASSGSQPFIKTEKDPIYEMKKEKDLINEEEKNRSIADTQTKTSNRYDSAFQINKNLLFDWAQTVESQAKIEATSPSKSTVSSIPKTPQKPAATAETFKLSDDDDDSADDQELLLSAERLNPKNPCPKISEQVTSHPIKTLSKELMNDEQVDISRDNSASKVQISHTSPLSVLDNSAGKLSEQFKVPKDVSAVSENVREDVSDVSDEDFLDVANVSANSLDEAYATTSGFVTEDDIHSASQIGDETKKKDFPDDMVAVHTLPDEDEMEQSEKSSQESDEPNQFEGLSQENIKDFQIELEAEQETLQQERGKQERLASSLTDQMYLEAQEMLRLFGLPYITSPMEAEAQCAYLDKTKQTDGTITEDSDIWLFGGQVVYKNFFNQNKQVECYSATEVKASIGLLREQMIKIALLCGSDYTPGIQGVGPVTAIEIMAEFPGENLEGLVNLKKWWDSTKTQVKIPQEVKLKSKLRQLEIHDGFPNVKVVDAYLNPTVDISEEPFTWAMPELDELRLFANNKMGWLRTKTDEALLPVLKQMNKPANPQLQITDFFASTTPRLERSPEKCKSKRVKRALQRCLQHVAVCPETSTSINEERLSRAKDVMRDMRKKRAMPKQLSMAGQGQRRSMPSTRTRQLRGAKVARTVQVKDELSLSESSSSDEH